MYALMHVVACAFLLVEISHHAATQAADSVEEIMKRVAANQDRAQELRSAFVYDQEIMIRFFRGDGKLA